MLSSEALQEVTAAARIRRLDEKAEIIVFEKSGYVSYANCGLPTRAGGVIQNKEELTLQTPESFWKRFQITMKGAHEDINFPERKTVVVKNMDTGESFEEVYDKLSSFHWGKTGMAEASRNRSG